MANHVWNGCVFVLSVVGLAVGVAENERTSEKQKSEEKVPKEAVVVMHATEGYDVQGTVYLTQEDEGVRLKGQVRSLSPGKHGFHIHEFGDLRAKDGTSAGDHFNPEGHKHGGLEDTERHAGDLGNITANSQGTAEVDVLAKDLKLHFVIGRSLVVHADEDDLESQPSGDAGDRAGVGVIGFASKDHKDPQQKPVTER